MQLLITVIASLLSSAAFAAPPKERLQRRQPSAGCGKVPPVAALADADRHTADGRLYHVYVPDSYDVNHPTALILSYHGLGGDWSGNAAESKLHQENFNTGQIVVYMQGLKNAEGATTWWGAPGATNDDIGYTNDVIDAIENQFCIDTSRIYATGMSQGGGLVGQLACDTETSRRIAAFAPQAGAFYVTAVDEEAECNPWTLQIPCSPGRDNIPIIALHGGNDTTISFEGGFRRGACLPAIRHWADQWSLRNGASPNPVTVPIDGTDDGKDLIYDDTRVRLVYAGDDVGHIWMSASAGTADIEATQWIIDFFNKYTL